MLRTKTWQAWPDNPLWCLRIARESPGEATVRVIERDEGVDNLHVAHLERPLAGKDRP